MDVMDGSKMNDEKRQECDIGKISIEHVRVDDIGGELKTKLNLQDEHVRFGGDWMKRLNLQGYYSYYNNRKVEGFTRLVDDGKTKSRLPPGQPSSWWLDDIPEYQKQKYGVDFDPEYLANIREGGRY